MAATKIADVIVPEVFNPYYIQRTMELSAFFQSGIIAEVSGLDGLSSKGGTSIAMPYWEDLSGDSEVLSDTTPLGVDKITSAQDIAVLHARGKAWGVNDLAKALAGSDPMSAIGDLVGDYWAREWQKMLISTLKGVFLAASMSGNISDISGLSGGAEVISGATLTDAQYKLGDAASRLTAIAMHSATEAKLAKDGFIEFVRDQDGNPMFSTYQGKRVVVDDSMPNSGGTYTTYLFGPGAIGLGEGSAPVPSETDRDSLQGEDLLINRRHFVLHPRGVAWIGTPTGVGPTNAELEVGTNWQRRWENKAIRIVQFKHKLA